MSKAILVKGGIGKVLSILPAIRRSGDLAISGGWHEFYSCAGVQSIEIDSAMVPTLTKDRDIVEVNPYLLAKVRQGEWNYTQGANYLVNGEAFDDKPICDLPKQLIEEARMTCDSITGGMPVVIINPVGSNNDGRSMVKGQLDHIISILHSLGITPIILADTEIQTDVEVNCIKANDHIQFAAFVAACDYLIGIDSAAMHIARARDIPGSIFFGATAGVKFYPDWFSEHRDPDIIDYKPYVQNLHINHHADLHDNTVQANAMHYEINEEQLRKELIDALKDKLPEEVKNGKV